MSYCLYLRKSRADAEAEARGEGETLARHEHALMTLGRQMGLAVTYIYREIVSGETIAARPAMQQLLSDVERGAWDGVLVMEVERFARGDTIDQGIVAQAFKFSGTKIITPAKIYDPDNEYDEEYFEFGLFMSRREYKTINRRLQRGRLASVREGKYVGSRPPYGYRRKKLEHDQGFTLVPDPEQAPVLAAIFQWYAFGEQAAGGVCRMSAETIARRLNDLKIPPDRGTVWGSASIRQMLRNPVYIGKVRWGSRPLRKTMSGGRIVRERPRAKAESWVLTDGLQEALVSSSAWDAVQARLGEHEACPPPGRELRNPLAGLVVCGLCGRKMVRRPYTDAGYPDVLMCPNASCGNVSARLASVEARILTALREWLEGYELPDGGAEIPAAFPPAGADCALRLARNELSSLQKQKENVCSLLERGIYTPELFQPRFQTVSRKIEDLSGTIAGLEQARPPGASAAGSPAAAAVKAEQVLQQYRDAASAAEKNALLRSVLEKAVYTKTANGRWHGKPDEFELILYPKLPKAGPGHG